MPIILSQDDNGTQRELIPEGQHLACCYSMIVVGTEHNEKYDKHQKKVRLTWEIPELRIVREIDGIEKDQPRVIGKKYTMSFHEKATLFQHLVSWRGKAFSLAELKEFDLERVLGKWCILQVLHGTSSQGNKYATINNIMCVPKGMPVPKAPENPLIVWNVDDGTPIPEDLPEWIQEEIKQSPEYQSRGEAPADESNTGSTSLDDEIPF